jgi:energy-coupling factor transporter ATP-binding protein EcfA2
MRVSKILIKGFQQFENFQLDLTHPDTGEPLEKVCLIGPNGTGKTTILNMVLWILRSVSEMPVLPPPIGFDALHGFQQSLVSALASQITFLALKVHADQQNFFVHIPLQNPLTLAFYGEAIEEHDEWKSFWTGSPGSSLESLCSSFRRYESMVLNLSGSNDVIIYEPADQALSLLQDPPQAPLNEVLHFFKGFPVYHSVSVAEASNFWKVLTYLAKKWESDYLSFLDEPENRDRTIRHLEAEFSQSHQKILPKISELWNPILHKCALELDLETASIPVQLTDSLLAYVKSKNTGEQLSYNQLSSGIRQYIFKLGYIKSLYFDRQIKRGFLLIDEPENCLYPDLLYDLMDDYWSIIENTQTFVSTHSPIVAAQFEPYERFHLDFDDRGYVTATRGVSPIGDDPNHLLYRDFQVRSIYGKKGLEKWNRYLELRRLIPKTPDPETKRSLMQEYLAIGNAYNFDPQ